MTARHVDLALVAGLVTASAVALFLVAVVADAMAVLVARPANAADCANGMRAGAFADEAADSAWAGPPCLSVHRDPIAELDALAARVHRLERLHVFLSRERRVGRIVTEESSRPAPDTCVIEWEPPCAAVIRARVATEAGPADDWPEPWERGTPCKP
jgi:hypothetical protein